MPQYRARIMLADGRPAYQKPVSVNIAAAATTIEAQLREDKIDPGTVVSITIKPQTNPKAGTYIGKARPAGVRRRPAAAAPAATEAAPATAAAATPAAPVTAAAATPATPAATTGKGNRR